MNLLSRRTALAAVSALMFVACGQTDTTTGAGGVAAVSAADHVKGSDSAPVTIIEYASPTCPACKYFHDSILPQLEENYVATGKVKFVFREYPVHGDVDVAAYVLALCAGEDKYFTVLDDLFDNQSGLVDSARSGVLKATLQTIGKRHGIETEAQFDACMANRAYREVMADKFQVANDKWGVNSTPTFVINGDLRVFEGDLRSYDGFAKYIDGLIGETAAPEAAEQ
ncbi:DsbA family protein [Hyphomonas sp.]|uniref:DsbA family protein n=1 Tax=Hyphomonas sp. TaxID=87 RepID=UPI003528949F